MAEERAERRLAAILAADVVGYSRLMEADEAGTLAALKERRKTILEPVVAEHRGRVVKLMGDGVLVEFASAINAVKCAVELQRRMREANAGVHESRHIVLRAGINLGDVAVEAGDIYGEAVNIAARLEQIAQAGGIVISKKVRDEIDRKLPITCEDLGEQALKNIATLIRVYRVTEDRETMLASDGLTLPDKPSIAVLPFTSPGGDPDQEHFCDGITQDLITDLSKVPGLFVIASHSSFAYKARAAHARSIAHELGVRYLLEGSARRAARQIRVNAQLIDARGGGHLWAERFDRSIDDIFAVQDEVAAKIVEALIGRLAASERPARNRPANLKAYDLCVRARMLLMESPQASREARMLLEQAIALDSRYAEAHRWLAFHHWIAWLHWGEPMGSNRPLAIELAQKAVALDPDDAGARWILGNILLFERRWPEAEAGFESALRLDPNHADAWAMLSNMSVFQGRSKEAIDQAQKALRLNPHPPSWYFWALGQAQYAAGRYEDAVTALRRDETYRTGSRRILAASLARIGRLDEARREAEMFLVSSPHFTLHHWRDTQPFQDEAMLQHFLEGYRKAGLPD